MKRWLKIQPYAIMPLLFALAWNCFVYWVSMAVCKDFYHYDFTLAFDRAVPFIPEWIYIYLICYLFWGANYVMSADFGKKKFYRFVAADAVSRVVCLVFFILLPTTNVRPEVVGNSLADNLMRWLYATDQAANLFPSIHCLVSWFCWIAIRGEKSVPKWYRAFSLIFAVLVIISTQTTKQHYIVDAIGGVVLAELCWWAAPKLKLDVFAGRIWEFLNTKLSDLIFRRLKK